MAMEDPHGRFTTLIAQFKSGRMSDAELWGEIERVALPSASSERATLAQLNHAAAEPRLPEPQQPARAHAAPRRPSDEGSVWAAEPDDPRGYPWAHGAELFAAMRAKPARAADGRPDAAGGLLAHPYNRRADGTSRPARADPAYPVRMDPSWQANVAELEAQRDARELAECTFRPAINRASRLPRNARGGVVPAPLLVQHAAFPPAGVYERSRAWERERLAHRASLREAHEAEEMRDCSFTPRIFSRGRNAATRPQPVRAARRETAGGERQLSLIHI